MKKEDTEVDVEVAEEEAAIKIEVVNLKLHMEIALMENVNHNIKENNTIIQMKKLRPPNKSKEVKEKVIIEILRLMRTLITTSITMLLDLNMKELKLLLIQKSLVSHPRKKGKSNQIK